MMRRWREDAHLLSPGPASAEGGFEEIHVVAGWDECGGTKHKKERGFSTVMYVTRLSSLCQHITAQTLAVQWRYDCLQELWQEVQNQHHHQQTQEACVWQASPQKKPLQLLHVGQGPPLMGSSSI